jgi:hypothetical protein
MKKKKRKKKKDCYREKKRRQRQRVSGCRLLFRYSDRLIGKLTVSLQLQEFSLRKPTVEFSTSAAQRSLRS